MKANEEFFEMAPPTMFSVAGGQFWRAGREAARGRDAGHPGPHPRLLPGRWPAGPIPRVGSIPIADSSRAARDD